MEIFENENNIIPESEKEDIVEQIEKPVEQDDVICEDVSAEPNNQETASFEIPQQTEQTYTGYTYQDYNNGQPQAQTVPNQPVVSKKPKKESSFSLTTLIASVVICAIISSVLSVGTTLVALNSDNSNNAGNSTNGGGSTNTNTTITNNTDNFVEAVAEKVQPSVVGISITYNSYNFFGEQSSSDSSGSGVIYTSDGYIITNKHVIDYAISRNGNISVYLNDNIEKSYEATVVGYDSSTDLAVIKISKSNLPAIEIGNSSELKVGQNAVAVGSPGGLQFMGSVSVGYISGLNRELTIDSAKMTLIQTDTAINPGNSGGALVDNEGKLIGITNAKLVSEEFEGMGFAIPVDKVTEICDKIIAGTDISQPYIGVNISNSYTPEILEGQGLPAGAVVASVVSNSPAYNAGIKAFDIIVAVDGVETKDYDKLVSAIRSHKVGDKMKVKIYRDGRFIELTVVVGTSN